MSSKDKKMELKVRGFTGQELQQLIETLGLKELPAVEKYGFLWVHPQEGGTIDLDDMLEDLARRVGSPPPPPWFRARYEATGEARREDPDGYRDA